MRNFIKRLRELAKKLAGSLGAAAGVAAAVLALATPTPASAQAARSIRMLSDGIVSLTVSNGIPYYNLNSVGANPTNTFGLSWTNAFGSNIVCGTLVTNQLPGGVIGFGPAGTHTTLTRGIDLWADATGAIPVDANLSCTFVAGAGNNTTNLLIFVPVYDGTNESTVAGDAFVWPITATGATPGTVSTNNPLAKWPGAQKFRLKAVYDGTNAAAGQFTILGLNLNAFPR